MRQAFLVLLADRPAHGYELKSALEQSLAGLLPPLNDGQVYTTLGRLERDGLVEAREVAGDGRGKRVYALTERGRQAAFAWLEAPAPEAKLKDEFFLKIALSVATGLGDPAAQIDAQRTATLRSLHDLDAHPDPRAAPAAALLREGVALHLQARLRWLDVCETHLRERREHRDGHGR